jgi:hypothetical protein
VTADQKAARLVLALVVVFALAGFCDHHDGAKAPGVSPSSTAVPR